VSGTRTCRRADTAGPPVGRLSCDDVVVIESADEFVRLRTSEEPTEYHRAANEPAAEAIWREIIDRFTQMRFWVAHNKTVPLSILEVLGSDPDERVRSMVRAERTTGVGPHSYRCTFRHASA